HQLKIGRRLVPERRNTIERRDLIPIDARKIVGPHYWHSRSSLFLLAGGLFARGRHCLDDLVCAGKVRQRTFGDGLVADLDLKYPTGPRHQLGLDTKALAQHVRRGLRAFLVAAGPAIDDRYIRHGDLLVNRGCLPQAAEASGTWARPDVTASIPAIQPATDRPIAPGWSSCR